MSDPWTMVLAVLPALAKIIEKVKTKKLSKAEKELLIEGAKDGEFYIISVDEVSDCVRVGKRNFQSIDDPAFTVKYLDAFKRLCERGYITHDKGMLYRLTYVGFKNAHKLAAKIKTKSVH